MKLSFKLKFITAGLALASLSACTKKLDLVPTNDITAEQVYSTPAGYKQTLAKIYLSMATSGNEGPAGNRDIPEQILHDEGNSDFLRGYWYLQELSTDEAGWTYHGDTDPLDIHQLAWSASNQTTAGSYYRSFFIITLANDFIRQASDDNLGKRGISGADADAIRVYKQEARFLRAYHYWILMDLYGNPPFVTENDLIGVGIPKQIKRKDLFDYIESELQDLETTLPEPKTNEYARADRAAAWALLARMYLNAEVYTGTAKYTEAINYCNKVIGAGYTLHPNYKELMLADNNLNTDEFILTIPFDGTKTQTWGGTTMLTHGPAGVHKDTSGTSGSWNCSRFTQQFVDKFPANDIRGQFWTEGQSKIMNQMLDKATDGYSTSKFKNRTRSGGPAPNLDPDKNFTDIDFPLFRLGEIYLIYAEAVLRGGTGGTKAQALVYYNALHRRGGATTDVTDITKDDVLDERARELFWECFRRTDLVRYDKFTTAEYLWAWKGNVPNGTSVDSKYNLFPIPSIDLSANPNLHQNPGY